MRRDLLTSLIAVVVLTVITGIAYPLVVTGIAQVAFPNKADGEQITRGGKVVGSRLLGQPFVTGTGTHRRADPRFFQPRPSADKYNPSSTFFSNRGPNDAAARFFYRDRLAAYLKLNGPYDPGLKAAGVPVDAVTTSASGVDPDISVANARIQARRVAAVRHLPLAHVLKLVDQHTDGRFLGLFGEPGVNVTTLNLAL